MSDSRRVTYFSWDALRKILYETPKRYKEGWRLTFCCEHNQVYKIEREPSESKPPEYTPMRLEDVEMDLQRILMDDFWGKIFVEGCGESIVSMTKKEVLKP